MRSLLLALLFIVASAIDPDTNVKGSTGAFVNSGMNEHSGAPWILEKPEKGRKLVISDAEGKRIRDVQDIPVNAMKQGSSFIPGLSVLGHGFNIFTGEVTEPILRWTLPERDGDMDYPKDDKDGNPGIPGTAADDGTKRDWNSGSPREAYWVPDQVQLTDLEHGEQSASTKAFYSASAYFESSSLSLGLDISSPIASAAFSMSRERSELKTFFESSSMAVSRQEFGLYQLKVLQSLVAPEKCTKTKNLVASGLCHKSAASEKTFLQSFTNALKSLPQMMYVPSTLFEKADDPKEEMMATTKEALCAKYRSDPEYNGAHFCYSDPSGTATLYCCEIKECHFNPEETEFITKLKADRDFSGGEISGLLMKAQYASSKPLAARYFAEVMYAARRFLWRWGTHYVASADYGGVLEVISTSKLASKTTESAYAFAAKGAIAGGLPFGAKGNATAGGGYDQWETTSDGSSAIETKVTVSGGASYLASADGATQGDWTASIPNGPVAIAKKLRPITDLVVEPYQVTAPAAASTSADEAATGEAEPAAIAAAAEADMAVPSPGRRRLLRMVKKATHMTHTALQAGVGADMAGQPDEEEEGTPAGEAAGGGIEVMTVDQLQVTTISANNAYALKRGFLEDQTDRMAALAFSLQEMYPDMKKGSADLDEARAAMDDPSAKGDSVTEAKRKCTLLQAKVHVYQQLWSRMSGLPAMACDVQKIVCDFEQNLLTGQMTKGLKKSFVAAKKVVKGDKVKKLTAADWNQCKKKNTKVSTTEAAKKECAAITTTNSVKCWACTKCSFSGITCCPEGIDVAECKEQNLETKLAKSQDGVTEEKRLKQAVIDKETPGNMRKVEARIPEGAVKACKKYDSRCVFSCTEEKKKCEAADVKGKCRVDKDARTGPGFLCCPTLMKTQECSDSR